MIEPPGLERWKTGNWGQEPIERARAIRLEAEGPFWCPDCGSEIELDDDHDGWWCEFCRDRVDDEGLLQLEPAYDDYKDEIEDLAVSRGPVRVELEERQDEKYLYLYVSRRTTKSWRTIVEPLSTNIPVAASEETIISLAQLMMDYLWEPVVTGSSIRLLCEKLSWADETWLF